MNSVQLRRPAGVVYNRRGKTGTSEEGYDSSHVEARSPSTPRASDANPEDDVFGAAAGASHAGDVTANGTPWSYTAASKHNEEQSD